MNVADAERVRIGIFSALLRWPRTLTPSLFSLLMGRLVDLEVVEAGSMERVAEEASGDGGFGLRGSR